MKRFIIPAIIFLGVLVSCDSTSSSSEENIRENPNPWVNAYLASWHHESPALRDSVHQLPTGDIDWQAITHLNYFALTFNENGILIPLESQQDTTSIKNQIDEIVSAAHNRDIPVLLSIGGWGSRKNFVQAIANGNRQTMISNLTNYLSAHDLDGIDLNIEPLEDGDVEYYEQFVNELHSALQPMKTPLLDTPLLTAATIWQKELFARIHPKLDQINLMTYNYSNAWEGWVTWHNSPVYNGNHTFPNNDKLLPSVHSDVTRYIEAGVPREKLGVGIDFYGYIWEGGVSGPLQGWTDSIPEVAGDVPYYAIMDSLYQDKYYHWDSEVKAAYLGIEAPDDSLSRFVSFEDEKAVEAKIRYAKENGLGGLMIWELSGGYRANQQDGQKQPLLKALISAL